MRQSLTGFSSTTLITAIETSLREVWRMWGRAPHSDLYDGAEMLLLYTGVPIPFYNGVVCAQLASDQVDGVIEATHAYFRERDAAWWWVVGAMAQPAFLDERLERHGLMPDGKMIGMAIDLRAMNEEATPPNDLTIVPVGDRETIAVWVQTSKRLRIATGP